MMDSVTIKLLCPIQIGSESIEEITIRPPTGKDLRKLRMDPGYELDTFLMLASRLSGQTDAAIDRLAGDDLQTVLETVSDFLGGALSRSSAR